MERYLNLTEIRDIKNSAIETFLPETIELSSSILKNKKEEITIRKNTLQACVNQYYADKKYKKSNEVNNETLKNELKLSYNLIMTVRNYFLGQGQEIKYKLYYRDPSSDLNDVIVYTLTEQELLNIVYRDKTTLRLPGTLSKAITDKFTIDYKATELFNKHFNKISNSLRHPSRSKSNYIVGKDIEHEYGKKNRIYAWQPGESNGNRGKSPYTFKLYNRGWIYQAFDATINKYGPILEQVSESDFRKEYFTEQLKYDNLKGFKGGDVGLNQIKTNAANLMSATTLLNYLKEIEKMLDDIIKQPDYNNTFNKIQTLFLNDDNKLDKDLNNYIDNIINKLLKASLDKK